MEQKLIFADKTEVDAIQIFGSTRTMLGSHREVVEIKVKSDYETVKSKVSADPSFIIHQTHEVEKIDEEGNPTGEFETIFKEYPHNEYTLFGDIVDHQDGTITFYLGKKTDAELLEEENAELLFALISEV